MTTVRLTVAQALVRFLGAQWSERDGERQRLFAGVLGIFGHGNVAGVGQALLQEELAAGEGGPDLPYVLARNEQAMVHTSVAYAKQRDRLQTWACTASVGPGSTNMLTGAALATINRLPVLLLPSSTFATRAAGPLLQELEQPHGGDLTVNDAFRPLSRFYDEVRRPEQLPAILLAAMRVLTDPAETGAVTISLPQDVQAEAHDWPVELFAERTHHVARPPAEASRIAAAAEIIRSAERPMIVAGGGVHYSGAEDALAALCEATGIPVGETQAGKGSLLHGHPQLLGAVGSTGTTAANAVAAQADVVIGIGTRYQDFTTASRTAFQDAGVRFVNLNVASFDAYKHGSQLPLIADAIGLANSVTSTASGNSTATAQVSSADAIRSARSRSPRSTAEATNGTTTAASAPPAMSVPICVRMRVMPALATPSPASTAALARGPAVAARSSARCRARARCASAASVFASWSAAGSSTWPSSSRASPRRAERGPNDERDVPGAGTSLGSSGGRRPAQRITSS